MTVGRISVTVQPSGNVSRASPNPAEGGDAAARGASAAGGLPAMGALTAAAVPGASLNRVASFLWNLT